jgi:hypothetical protein
VAQFYLYVCVLLVEAKVNLYIKTMIHFWYSHSETALWHKKRVAPCAHRASLSLSLSDVIPPLLSTLVRPVGWLAGSKRLQEGAINLLTKAYGFAYSNFYKRRRRSWGRWGRLPAQPTATRVQPSGFCEWQPTQSSRARTLYKYISLKVYVVKLQPGTTAKKHVHRSAAQGRTDRIESESREELG